MRIMVAATATGIAAVAASGVLGVASAEAPSGAPARSVDVVGVATVPLAQGASAATATSVYRQAMGAAIADGQTKAQFIAEHIGATLGAVQTVGERGGDISCMGPSESGYLEYEGQQPDFPPGGAMIGGVLKGAAAPGVARRPTTRRTHRRHGTAVKATVGSCTLTTSVSLVYVIG